jgi:hypothetical protein
VYDLYTEKYLKASINFIYIISTLLKYLEGRTTGFEPANDEITTHCLNHLATPANSFNYINYYNDSIF